MTLGTHHCAFPMDEASRVGEARRHAAGLADACGFDETDAGRLARAVLFSTVGAFVSFTAAVAWIDAPVR